VVRRDIDGVKTSIIADMVPRAAAADSVDCEDIVWADWGEEFPLIGPSNPLWWAFYPCWPWREDLDGIFWKTGETDTSSSTSTKGAMIIDNSGLSAFDITNRIAFDTGAATSADFDERWLVKDGRVVVQWGTGYPYSGDLRTLLFGSSADPEGNGVGNILIDTQSHTFWGVDGNWVFRLNSGKIWGGASYEAETNWIDLINGKIGDAEDSIDWVNRYLYDTADTPEISVDWDERYLNDAAGELSVDWDARELRANKDISGTITPLVSVDWAARELKDNADTPKVSIDWVNREAWDGASTPRKSIGWAAGDRCLYDADSNPVVDWNARMLTNSESTPDIVATWGAGTNNLLFRAETGFMCGAAEGVASATFTLLASDGVTEITLTVTGGIVTAYEEVV
jgi:hypothetical protein